MYFYLFKSDENNQWYWRLKATNGNIIADGAEGYINKKDAIAGINLVRNLNPHTPIFDGSTGHFLDD